MSEEKRKIATECSQLYFSSTCSSALVNIRQELGILTLEFKDSQMQYLRTKAREKLSNLTCDASSTDTLIESFGKRQDVNYLHVTHHPNEDY